MPEDERDKTLLIEALETSDDDPRFELFSDLAAELRVRIYELHFLDLCDSGDEPASVLFFPVEPAIAKVGRLLRQEALPVFYDTVPLSLPIYSPSFVGHFQRRLRTSEAYSAKVRHRERFLRLTSKAPPDYMSRFKKVHLTGRILLSRWLSKWRIWEIELARGCKEASVRCFAVADDGQRQQVEEQGIEVKGRARIEEVLKTIPVQQGRQLLRAVDRDTFARVGWDDQKWKGHLKAVDFFFPTPLRYWQTGA